ncbi:MAG: zeta toxin family protein [Azoarcus sp.]|jgi:predicted ABC-type ATPase|nr:zeta toxin family protein [Azoarcus sp.]
MPDYIPLSDEEIALLAQEHYENIVPLAKAQKTPTMMLVGGQPGAGKSYATEAARAELYQTGGVIHIDADEFHSRINRLKRETFTASQTHSDCKKIALLVRDHAFEGKRNILEEGLFRRPDALSSLAERAHRSGYKCEIIAIAVSREQSRLSVLERREFFRDACGYVRDISEDKQDVAYKGFTEALLKDADKFDRVRVMGRAGVLFYDSEGGGPCQSVHEGLEKGRSLSDEQVVALTRQWEALHGSCVTKGIPAEELARVDEGILFFNAFKNAERHRHGMQCLEENYRSLVKDPHYASHCAAELTKAAFYWGVIEKKQIFEGRAADLFAIDATLSNREALHHLPEIDEIEDLMLSRMERIERERNRSNEDGLEP